MSTLRIGLLLAGAVDEASRHVAGDYPELFGALLGGHDVALVPYDVRSGHLPASTGECDGWVCSPSRSSVYDDEPWIGELQSLLRHFVEDAAPFVGICFGHQLLAQALGGRVERSPRGWGVGVHEYRVVRPLPWHDGEPVGTVRLLASHQDQVVDLPDAATTWATSEFCPHAGFTVGETAWTIQTHPEFVPELAEHLLARRVELIGDARAREARSTLDQPLDRARFADWMVRFFSSASR